MGYDFHKLKTIQCGPSLTLRIPARWQVNGTEEDGWYCDEDNDEETGTLWITLFRDNAPKKPGFDPRIAVEELIAFRIKNASPPLQQSDLSELNGKFFWTYFFDSDDRGERIRNLFHMVFVFDGDRMAVVAFNLVLLVSQLNDPEIRNLIGIIEKEIRDATIEPFVNRRENGMYADLRRANFASKIRLVLPEALDIRNQDDGHWYCFFPPEGLKARIDVMTDDHFAKDDSGKRVKVEKELFETVVRRLVGDNYDSNRNIYLPDGILSYEIYDTDPEGEGAPPHESVAWLWGSKRNHYWRYFRLEEWRIRQAQFQLAIPLDADEELNELIQFLDREIRNADFPDDSMERS